MSLGGFVHLHLALLIFSQAIGGHKTIGKAPGEGILTFDTKTGNLATSPDPE